MYCSNCRLVEPTLIEHELLPDRKRVRGVCTRCQIPSQHYREYRPSFMDHLMTGEESRDIDDDIDLWHDTSQQELHLHYWLGMTRAEYNRWVKDPKSLADIVKERRELEKGIVSYRRAAG